jgi:hypothetical protein
MRDAAMALARAEPRLVRIATAAEALGLSPRELLHAGPPLDDPTHPPAPLRSAAVITARHAGWATSETQAEAMLAAGELKLSPAQARSCVTPLAAVVSAGTPLVEVVNGAKEGAGEGTARAWAPLSPLGGPDTRMGHRDPAILARLADRDIRVAPLLARWLDAQGPLPLWPLAARGLADGDDLHSRTTQATAALAEHAPPSLRAELLATPLFFLTIWMAACAAMMRALEGLDQPGWVTRAGGNGERFGIALAGRPERWHTVPATAPEGWRLPTAAPEVAVCGAIGDSAVIDLLGLGGQRLAMAPEPLSVLGPVLPDRHADIAARLLRVPHPALPGRWPLGLDAAALRGEDDRPLVCLAMIAADGVHGLLGRGVWRVPAELLADAAGAAAA